MALWGGDQTPSRVHTHRIGCLMVCRPVRHPVRCPQFQLHIQYMLPPFLPFHYVQYLEGNHMTSQRFFPLEYIKVSRARLEPTHLPTSH